MVYIYDDRAVECNFSAMVPQHAMKPFRALATWELVQHFHLDRHLRVVRPPDFTLEDLQAYHSVDYLANLKLYNSQSWVWHPETSRVNFNADCPPVEGILDHSLRVAAGSVMGAVLLNAAEADIAIHWAGGMHHARCGECSGFCYINDVVLSILELLKVHQRVLYIDIDMHHGDGVEEAFLTSDRVFTLSLHRYGDGFFPGTGAPSDVGLDRGKWFAMNLCLWDGIRDFHYVSLFQYAVERIVKQFRPDAIVLQCGADSIAGDRVGVFNLSSVGHGACVSFVRQLRIPLLVLGGGGYTMKNVVKLWAYETSILCGAPLPQNTKVQIEQLPLSGWVTETAPLLHVAAEETPARAVSSFGKAYHRVKEQIDAHIPNISFSV